MVKYKYLKNPGINTWLNAPEQTPKEYEGFVYEIIEKETKKKYIGIKHYWKTYKLKPLKNKKHKRIYKKETKWREYNTSGIIKEKIQKYPKKYVKRIIKNCETTTDMKAVEAYYQLKEYIEGRWDKLYNEMINLRIRIRKK